jgi:hypothetical protein
MLLLIIVLLLLFGGGGGYYGYSKWGPGGGLGIVGTVLLIESVLYLIGAVRCSVPNGTALLHAGCQHGSLKHRKRKRGRQSGGRKLAW